MDDAGQLALMDAIVFLLAAMAVSGVLFSSIPRADHEAENDTGSWYDAERTLAAILGSSLGADVHVTVCGEPLTLSERVEIAECLLLEAHVIAEGDGHSDFSALDRILLEVVLDVSPPSMKSRLLVSDLKNGTPHELVAIPGDWSETVLVYAATAELADSEGGTYLVQLLSAPAAALEPP